jgi:hypothetical protein
MGKGLSCTQQQQESWGGYPSIKMFFKRKKKANVIRGKEGHLKKIKVAGHLCSHL